MENQPSSVSRETARIVKLNTVPVDSDLNALIKHDTAFPFAFYHDDLSNFVGGFVNWHKQSALEISVVLEGGVTVSVLEKEETVAEGEAFLILPKCLHMVRPSKGHKVARYFTLIFEPALLTGFKGSFFERAYYLPALTRKEQFFKFSDADAWSSFVFEQLYWVYERFPDDTPVFQLALQRKLQDIWIVLWEQLISKAKEGDWAQNSARILEMIDYLHEHYGHKFSLDDMASHAHVSRSECCRYFKRMMRMTISDFLKEYRLSAAAEFLENTEMTIAEIADAAGFSSASYFILSFRQKTGYTPLAYRRRANAGAG